MKSIKQKKHLEKLAKMKLGKTSPLKGKKRPPFSKEWIENMSKAQIGKKNPCSEETRRKISEALKGNKITWGHKISLAKKGKPSPLKGRKGIGKGRKLSKETKERMSKAQLKRYKEKGISKGQKENAIKLAKISKERTGEKNNNWKGGITSENEKIRKSTIYKLWHKRILGRYRFICQKCRII